MLDHATVEEIVPLIEALSPPERTRLLRLIGRIRTSQPEAFAADEDPLAWESAGWENLAWCAEKSANTR